MNADTSSPFAIGERIRTIHTGRTGTVMKVYPDGSACITWDDKPASLALGHERMPRDLLTAITSSTTSPAVTRSTSFHTCTPDRINLFAVRPGVPLPDAFEKASCTLAAILRIVRDAAVDHDDEILHGAVFLIEAVKALVDSAEMPPALPALGKAAKEVQP